jgi:hypothetical protein
MVEIGQKYGLGDVVTPNFDMTMGVSQDNSYFSTNASTILGSPLPSQHEPSQQQQQPPMLDIAKEDMDEYFRTVKRKEGALQERLAEQKANLREQEDQYNDEISDLKGKLKALEGNKERLHKLESDSRREMEEIRKRAQKGEFATFKDCNLHSRGNEFSSSRNVFLFPFF